LIAWVLLGGFSASLNRRKRGSLHVAAALLILWAYAVMVGLAPPVTRATLMITIGLIGPVLFRRAASINTVAGAAFLMLAIDCSLIADPGFQLSFTAVAAIVTIALPITGKLKLIGEWRPSAHSPHPPSCSYALRKIAESLFWNERKFRQEIGRAPVRYRLDKSRAARLLGRVRAQALLRSLFVLFITSLAIQVATFPLSALYFNRVTAVGVLLNIATGLLTGVMIFAALLTMIAGSISAWAASQLAWITETTHFMLVNSIGPFSDLSGATFRVAHYEDWRSVVYSIYFVPLALVITNGRGVDRRLARAACLHGRGRASAETTRERQACDPLSGRGARRFDAYSIS
jgi:competence protein ComEC